jgi:drug/metabolite transporter (DMT)-like permease
MDVRFASQESAGLGRRLTVLAAAYGTIVLWGASPLATKVAVGGIDPLAVGVLRTLLGALVALPILLVGEHKLPRSRFAWTNLAVSALGGFVFFPLLFSLGLKLTTAGHGALLLGILPVFTGLIAAVLEDRAPSGRWWLGCVVALVGTAVLVGERFGFAATEASLSGNLLVLVGAAGAAAGYVTGARAAREIGTWPVTLWGLVIGGIVLLPVSPFVLSPSALAQAGPLPWGGVLYQAFVTSILGYALWYWALSQGGIGRTGVTQFVQPLIGLVLAVALLGEALTWPMILAAALILGGVAFARGRA